MLDYFALFLVFFVILVLFYGIIVVHDIPYEIAVRRQHPHQDAIHVAGWISLFTLGAIWPFLWIWATLYKPGIGWGMIHNNDESIDSIKESESKLAQDIAVLQQQVAILTTNHNEQDKEV
ncbi:DUF3302 domain-containing protein [Colwellia psychrerythraea]|uniref:GTPase n=1 Tax=Colwellia psychrerythraea TaxID=28229 RepID=A0A099KZ84_COLPS|nr:DUF3302 domain-containing protein [Colwellia psychrerythraea]KGJ95107.1 protein of unknown function UCP028770 [Colwellia psychrerythraea]